MLVLMSACDLYWSPLPHTQPPDVIDASSRDVASLDDPACGGIDCGDGRHCEIECSQYGQVGCPYNCHTTCMPDMPCGQVDTCLPPTVCMYSCFDTCQAMANLCQLSCAAQDGSCQQITDEAACLARSDCMTLYHASGCSCSDDDCTCTNEMGSFARCDTTMQGNT